MIVSRKAPKRDHGSTPLAGMELGLLDTEFDSGESYEDAPKGFIRINLNKGVFQPHDADRLTVLMSPYELLLAFATLPADVIGPAAKEFFSHFQRHDRNDTDLKQPMCAITKREFNERVVALLQACLE